MPAGRPSGGSRTAPGSSREPTRPATPTSSSPCSRVRRLTAFLIEAFRDAGLAAGGFGRASNGNIVVSKLEVAVLPAHGGDPLPGQLIRAEADEEQQKSLHQCYHEKLDGPVKRAETARDAATKSLADFRNT